MKKLIALSLVLAVAGLANAGWEVSKTTDLVAGDVITISYIADYQVAGLSIRNIADSASVTGAMSDCFVNAGMTSSRKVGVGIVNAGGKLMTNTTQDGLGGGAVPAIGGTYVEAGQIVASFKYTVKAGNNETFTLKFDDGVAARGIKSVQNVVSPLAAITLQTIPEPITMGLLSLGALFIRKRK